MCIACIHHKCMKIRSFNYYRKEKRNIYKARKRNEINPQISRRLSTRSETDSYFTDHEPRKIKNLQREKCNFILSWMDFSTYNVTIIVVIMVQKGEYRFPTVRLTHPSCHLAVTCIVAQVILQAAIRLRKFPVVTKFSGGSPTRALPRLDPPLFKYTLRDENSSEETT